MSYCEDLFYRSLRIVFPESVKIWRNYRPDFLKNSFTGRNLEYDYFFPDFSVAFEIQGDKHYTDVGQAGRDNTKRDLSVKNGIYLFEVSIFQLQPCTIRRKVCCLLFKLHKRIPLNPYNKETYDLMNKEISEYSSGIKNKYGNESLSYRSPVQTKNLIKNKILKIILGKLSCLEYNGKNCRILSVSKRSARILDGNREMRVSLNRLIPSIVKLTGKSIDDMTKDYFVLCPNVDPKSLS